MQPTLSMDSQGVFLEYESEATWPVVRLKWQDYPPEAFVRFFAMLTDKRVEISRLRFTEREA